MTSTSRLCGLLFAVITICAPGSARGTDWCPGFGPFGFDEPVWGAVEFDGDLIVIGAFNANGSTKLPRIARWDGAQWQAMGDPGWGFVEVVAACVYNGDLYISGRRYENQAVLLKWNGTSWDLVDQPLGFNVDGQVTSMLVYDGKLFLAGELNGTPEQDFGGSVVAWDGLAWITLNDPPDYLQATDMVEYQGDLYLTGDFTEAGGAPAHSLARWDGTQWTAVNGFANGMWGEGLYRDGFTGGARGRALAVYEDRLVIGGLFNRAGQLVVSNLVAWDGSTETWQSPGNVDGTVTSLAVSGTSLIAGGVFQSAGGVAAANVARYDGAAWSPLGSGTDDRVNVVFVHGTDLVLGGFFRAAGGETRGHLALWDGSSYAGIENDGSGADDEVLAMVEYAGDLIIGGEFTAIGTTPANRLARWDGDAWSEFGGGAGNAVRVRALHVDGADLYAGGEFTSIGGGTAANRIAKWNGAGWEAIGSGATTAVYAIQMYNGTLYEGGYQHLRRWTGASWESVALDHPSTTVHALAVFDGKLVVGGDNQFLRAYDGSAWTVMGSIDNTAQALVPWEGWLYVGGRFDNAAGQPASGLARWNGTTLEAIGAVSYIDDVHAMTVANNALHVTGSFGGSNIAWLEPGTTEWQSVDTGWEGVAFGLAIGSRGGEVFVGGSFIEMTDGDVVHHLGRLCPDATAVRGAVPSGRLDWSLSPNPFNPWVMIRFLVRDANQPVDLRIFDVRGALVRTLVAGSRPAGSHDATWDGRDDRGGRVASGVYLARLRIGTDVDTKRAVLLR